MRVSLPPVMALCAAIFGILITIAAQFWYASWQPTPIQVNDVMVGHLPSGDLVLDVKAIGPPTRNCVRITQHVLYRADAETGRHYFPLAVALNGVGFGSVPAFTATLVVPYGVTGDWLYVNRSAYFCTIWPGLLAIHETASKPYPVTLK